MRLIWNGNIFRSVGLRCHQMWRHDKTPQGCMAVVWHGESRLINLMGPVRLPKDMIGCGSVSQTVAAKSWAPEVCLSFWMWAVAVTVRAKTNGPDWEWVGKSCISAALDLVWMQFYFYRQKVFFFTALRLNTTLMCRCNIIHILFWRRREQTH